MRFAGAKPTSVDLWKRWAGIGTVLRHGLTPGNTEVYRQVGIRFIYTPELRLVQQMPCPQCVRGGT